MRRINLSNQFFWGRQVYLEQACLNASGTEMSGFIEKGTDMLLFFSYRNPFERQYSSLLWVKVTNGVQREESVYEWNDTLGGHHSAAVSWVHRPIHHWHVVYQWGRSTGGLSSGNIVGELLSYKHSSYRMVTQFIYDCKAHKMDKTCGLRTCEDVVSVFSFLYM